MSSTNKSRPASSPHGSMPLDAARTAFQLVATGPEPISINGRLFADLPDRRVPLDEVRDRLLARDCRQATRDAVWAHLVLLARTKGEVWTVGCVGVALPALTRVAARLSARFAADPADIHAEVLSGFLHAISTVDLRRPRIMLRLRWAAYRAGHAALTEALNAPTPCGDGFRSAEPPPPYGHPDLVLARAVVDKVITAAEANLIGTTRLEKVPLRRYAASHEVSYEACKKIRQRAERRLVAYLLAGASDQATTRPHRSSRVALAAPATKAGDQAAPGSGRQLTCGHVSPGRTASAVPITGGAPSSVMRENPTHASLEESRCA